MGKSLVFSAIAGLFLVAGVLLAVQNLDTTVTIKLGQETLSNVSLGLVFFGVLFAGFIGATIQMAGIYQRVMIQFKRQQLERQKAEVTAETQSDTVKALESKIATLEKALAQALGNTPATSKKTR